MGHIVTVIQGAVEEIDLSKHGVNPGEVDIIISEWMGYFLLRESMLDSLIHARDKFLKPKTGLMLPSHTTMYVAPIRDEQERSISTQEYASAMSEWTEFADTTKSAYGVDMSVLGDCYEREQKEYFLLSSRWAELPSSSVLATPAAVKTLDMCTCTLEDSKGIMAGDHLSTFDFDVVEKQVGTGNISGFAGWFDADFKSRTDEGGEASPVLANPAYLTTGPEAGYTHWGQQGKSHFEKILAYFIFPHHFRICRPLRTFYGF